MKKFKKFIEEEKRRPVALPPGSNTQLQAIKFYPGTNLPTRDPTHVTDPAYNAWYNINVLINHFNQSQPQSYSGIFQPIPYEEFLQHWNQTYENILGNNIGYGYFSEMPFDKQVEFFIGVFGQELGLLLVGLVCYLGGVATIGGVSVVSILGGAEIGLDAWDMGQLTQFVMTFYGMSEQEAQDYINYILASSATGSNAEGIFAMFLRDIALQTDDMLRGDRRTLVKQIGENLYQIYRWNPKTSSWEPFGLPVTWSEISNSTGYDPAGGLGVPFYGIDDDLPGNPHMHEFNPPPINPLDLNMPIGPRPQL